MIKNDGNGKNVSFGVLGKLGLEGPKWGLLGFRAHLGKIDRKWNLEKLHVNTVSIVVKFGLSKLNQHS